MASIIYFTSDFQFHEENLQDFIVALFVYTLYIVRKDPILMFLIVGTFSRLFI